MFVGRIGHPAVCSGDFGKAVLSTRPYQHRDLTSELPTIPCFPFAPVLQSLAASHPPDPLIRAGPDDWHVLICAMAPMLRAVWVPRRASSPGDRELVISSRADHCTLRGGGRYRQTNPGGVVLPPASLRPARFTPVDDEPISNPNIDPARTERALPTACFQRRQALSARCHHHFSALGDDPDGSPGARHLMERDPACRVVIHGEVSDLDVDIF